ncbi:MAG: MaoC/PaaZ C-terminal domain-containing protein [Clostridiaceae bacterium]|nr:MaoC/PaaZ C-terminal domain-containing protein [Clostridiaceae bacterium]
MKKFNTDLYYGDIEVGDEFITATRTISEADVMLFAGLTGDYNELHTSASFAEKNAYGERIAHGMLTLAMANGLYMRLNHFNNSTIANLGIKDWKFTKAVKFGDTIYTRIVLMEKSLTSNPARGIINWHVDVCNQNDEVVATGTWVKMLTNRQV